MFQRIIQRTQSVLFTTLVLSAVSAQASHRPVRLSEFSIAGSGCPQGSASVKTDRNTGIVTITPDNFTAVLDERGVVARNSCSFAATFEGSSNRAVRITVPRIRGSVALDQDSTARISYEVFFAGQRAEPKVLSFNGHQRLLETNFDETDRDLELVYNCGQGGILRGNASILVNSQSEGHGVALAQVRKMGLKVDSIPCR